MDAAAPTTNVSCALYAPKVWFIVQIFVTARLRSVRVALIGVLIAALAAAGVISVPLMAAATTGAITGTIYLPDGTSTVPHSFGIVRAWKVTTESDSPADALEYSSFGYTDFDLNNGSYTIPQLEAGEYYFEFIDYSSAKSAGGAVGWVDGSATRFDSLYDAFADSDPITLADDATLSLDFTLATANSVSGLVTDAASQVGLAGQPVHLLRRYEDRAGVAAWQVIGEATTPETVVADPEAETPPVPSTAGEFSFDRLPAGTYTISAGGTGDYAAEFWLNVSSDDPSDGTSFELDGTAKTTNLELDSTLPTPELGSISGTIKSGTTALLGATATVYGWVDDDEYEYEPVGTATTTTGGAFTIENVPVGEYFVGFEGPTAGTTRYFPEFWLNADYAEDAAMVVVDADETTTHINGTLTKSASISGTVTGAGGVTLGSDVYVSACTYDFDWGVECDFGSPARSDGSYTIGVPAGKYTIVAQYTGTGNFRDEYFPNVRYAESASYFAVTGTSAVTGKNLLLDAGLVIQGEVTGVNDEPLEGVHVTANLEYEGDVEEHYWDRGAISTAGGHYEVGGLWPDTYSVYAHGREAAPSYAGEWFDNTRIAADATRFTLTANSSPTTANLQLSAGAVIAGTVTASDSSAPVAGINVDLYQFTSTSNAATRFVTSTRTDSNGTYSIGALAAGEYTIRVGEDESEDYSDSDSPQTGYLSGYYGAAPGQSAKYASRIPVGVGETATANYAATLGGSFSGVVVDVHGDPLSNVYVDLANHDGSAPDFDADITDETGAFRVTGLPAASDWTLGFDAWDPDTDDGGPYSYRTLPVGATTVNAPTTDLGDVQLQLGGTINGVLLNTAGKPIKNADVYLAKRLPDGSGEDWTDAKTSATGAFSFTRLAAGEYFVRFEAKGYANQYAGGASELSLSAPIVVGTASSTNRQFTLYSGGSISGTVKDASTGKSVKNIEVFAFRHTLDYTLDYSSAFSTVTDAKGNYVLPGISAGSWTIVYYDERASESSQYDYLSSSVFVADKAAVKKNITLQPLTRISGYVQSTGNAGLGYSNVRIQSLSEEYYSLSMETDSTGDWAAFVNPGEYVIQGYDARGRAATGWYRAVGETADRTTVVVAKKAISRLVVSLETVAGGVTARFAGNFSDDLYADVRIVNDLTDEIAYSSEDWSNDLSQPVTITQLHPGNYSLVVEGYDEDTHYFIDYPFEVTTAIVDLGTLTLDSEPFSGWSLVVNTSLGAPTGTPMVGGALFADPGTWTQAGEPLALTAEDLSYQWLRDGKPILSANGIGYTLTPGDFGKRISVRVTPPSGEAVVSPRTSAIAIGDEIVLYTPPTITGTVRVGQTLKSSPGVWSDEASVISYSWTRETGSTTKIVSTSASYKPVAADAAAGATLSLRLTATRAGLTTGTWSTTVTVAPAVALKQSKKSVITLAGGTYTVTPGTWSPSGASVTYSWRTHTHDWFVEEATSTSFTPSTEQLEQRLTVVVTAAKAGYASTSVEYELNNLATPIVWNLDPSIQGANQVGKTLTVTHSEGETTPVATSYSYQWFAGTKAITGATKASYAPTKVGTIISVDVTAHLTGFPSSSPQRREFGATTAASGTIDGAFALDYGSAPAVGRPIAVAWSSPLSVNAPALSYQWFRVVGGEPAVIPKATKASYTPVPADAGNALTLRITVKKSGYTTTVLTTSDSMFVIQTRVASVTAPTIPKIVTVGTKVTGTVGNWDLPGTTYAFQWYINDRAIVGATSASYTPLPADVDERISLAVVAKKTGFEQSAETFAMAVTVLPAAAPKATKAPVLTVGGKSVTTTVVGKDLVTSAGTWATPGVALSYGWQYSIDNVTWTDLEGYPVNSIHLDEGTKDYHLRSVITATKAGSITGVAYSRSVLVK
jgi:hypothetical protein